MKKESDQQFLFTMERVKSNCLKQQLRLLPCLTEEQLAYIIGMEQAEEYKEKEGAKEDDKSVL